MKIEALIEKLTDLQKAGATVVSIVDSNWNDYDIDSVEKNDAVEFLERIDAKVRNSSSPKSKPTPAKEGHSNEIRRIIRMRLIQKLNWMRLENVGL